MTYKKSKWILITGANGFIGYATVKELLKENFNLICLDIKYDIDKKEFLRNQKNVKIIESDLREEKTFEQLSKIENIDKILHLAAFAGVRPSINNPLKYYENNVLVTRRILKYMKEKNITNLIFSSSSSIYGDSQLKNKDHRLSESTKNDDYLSPYAKNKATSEKDIIKFGDLINYIIFRYFTVYGPNQRKDLAISKFINNAIDNEPIEKYGDGTSYRDYTYIDDVVRANVIGLKKIGHGTNGIFNICSSEKVFLNQLIDKIKKKFKNLKINETSKKECDVFGTFGSNEKAKNILNWEPKTKFNDGIAKFIMSIEEDPIVYLFISKNKEEDKKYIEFINNNTIQKFIYCSKLDFEDKIKNDLNIVEWYYNDLKTNNNFDKLKWRANLFIDKEGNENTKIKYLQIKENEIKINNITKKRYMPFFHIHNKCEEIDFDFVGLFLENQNEKNYLVQIKEKLTKSKKLVDKKTELLFSEEIKDELNKKTMDNSFVVNAGNEGTVFMSEDKKTIHKLIRRKKYNIAVPSEEKYKLQKVEILRLQRAHYMIDCKVRGIKNNFIIFSYKNSIYPINKIFIEDLYWSLYNQKNELIMVDDIKKENLGIIYKDSFLFPKLIFNDFGRGIYKYEEKYFKGLVRDYLIFFINKDESNCRKIIWKNREEIEKKYEENYDFILELIFKNIKLYNSMDGKPSRKIIPMCICQNGIKAWIEIYKKRLNFIKKDCIQFIKICSNVNSKTLSFWRKEIDDRLYSLNRKTEEITVCKKIDKNHVKGKLLEIGFSIIDKEQQDFTYKWDKDGKKFIRSYDHILWEIKKV